MSAQLSARALALPSSTFPRGARIHGARLGNAAATRATALHTKSFAALGRIDGYIQTASWLVRVGRRQSYGLTLQYGASIFESAGRAGEAYSDAGASLWEYGHPLAVAGLPAPAFIVSDRHGHTTIYVLLQQGPIETELSVRYRSADNARVSRSALAQIRRVGVAAAATARRVASSRPEPPSTATEAPNVFVAPLDTGPVVKSPSLMVLDTSIVSDGATQLDGGAYREASAVPLAHTAKPAAAVVPSTGLTRFVELGWSTGGTDLYNSTTLYANNVLAGTAFDRLVQRNRALRLQRYDLRSSLSGLRRLAAAGGARAWRLQGETVLALLSQNVVIVLAQHGSGSTPLPLLADRLLSTVPTWLHAEGTQIVDSTGSPVHLDGLNWYGAEQLDFVVGGLDFQSYGAILSSIKAAGYNSIRLPYSNQLVEQNPVVSTHVRANPELAGLHALEVLDRIIQYAGALGLSVILDNHRSDAGWSSQENGLWYTDQYSDDAFTADWAAMARRYAGNNAVIGADLRNEPHGPARWGNGDPATDWKMAAERAGNMVLAANPHLLVMVEGVQFYGAAPSYWWGGNLMGVATAPVSLHFPNGDSARSQLVYSAHDYGVDNCGTGCPWFNPATSYDSLAAVWDQYWGYITSNPAAPYAAPVWVGEFGTCNYNPSCVSSTVPGSQGQWLSSLVRYIGAKHLSWAYWSANATQSTASTRVYGDLDWYGYFQRDWVEPVSWLTAALRAIQTDSTS